MEEKITKYVTEKRAAVFLVFLAAFFAGSIAAACVMKYQGTEERQSGINGMTEMKGGNNADASENVGNKEAQTAAVSGSTVLRDAAEGNWGLKSFSGRGKTFRLRTQHLRSLQNTMHTMQKTRKKNVFI